MATIDRNGTSDGAATNGHDLAEWRDEIFRELIAELERDHVLHQNHSSIAQSTHEAPRTTGRWTIAAVAVAISAFGLTLIYAGGQHTPHFARATGRPWVAGNVARTQDTGDRR